MFPLAKGGPAGPTSCQPHEAWVECLGVWVALREASRLHTHPCTTEGRQACLPISPGSQHQFPRLPAVQVGALAEMGLHPLCRVDPGQEPG